MLGMYNLVLGGVVFECLIDEGCPEGFNSDASLLGSLLLSDLKVWKILCSG